MTLERWLLISAILGAIADTVAVLDYFGIKIGRKRSPMSRSWKLLLVLALLFATIGLSGYGFFLSYQPHIVEKVVEKPVERLVTVPCKQPPTVTKSPTVRTGNNSPALGSITQGAGSAFSQNQSGGITAGTVNFGPPPPSPLQLALAIKDAQPTMLPGYKYKKEITLTPNIVYSPVSLQITCSAKIEKVFVNNRMGGGFHGGENVNSEDDKLADIWLDDPKVTPEVPLLIYIGSNNPFDVLSVQRVKFSDLPYGDQK